MSSREIEARLKLTAVDRASAVLGRVGAKMGELDRKARTMTAADVAVRAQAERAAAIDNRLVGIGRGLLAAAGAGAAARGIKVAISDYAALERQVTRIGLTAGATDEQIDRVSRTIAKVADDAAMPLADVYAGFDGLIAAGRSWEDSLSFLPSVVNTAQAAGAEVSDIAQTADSLATNFGVAGNQMQEAFDKLVQGGQLGKFELKDMASYLPSILPQMKALGYSGLDGLEQTVAMLQTVRLQTGTAGEAATNLTNVLGKVYSPETIKKFSENFDIDIVRSLKKATENGEDLLEAFVRISREATGGDMEKLSQLFTDQQLRAGMLALMQGGEAWADYKRGVENAAGAVQNNLNRVLDDTQASIDRLSNSWDSFTTAVGKVAVAAGAETVMRNAAANLTGFATFLDDVSQSGPLTALGNVFERGNLETAADDPGGKAYIEAYRRASGKDPTADQARAFVLFGGGPDAVERWGNRTPEERAAAAAEAGRLAGAAEAYRPLRERATSDTRARIDASGARPVAASREAANLMPWMAAQYPGASVAPMQSGRFERVRGARLDDPLTSGPLLPGATQSIEELQRSFEALNFAGPIRDAGAAATQELKGIADGWVAIVTDANKRISAGLSNPFRFAGPTSAARVDSGPSMPEAGSR